MASYGVAITLPLPTAGQVQWDGPLGDLLQAFIDVLGRRVTVDGMDIAAALDMNGHALVDATAIEFIANSDPGVANSLYYGAGGELFCRDGTNRAVQLTSGGVVNVAGSGGFGGDYTSSNQNGASFTNATSTFTFTASGGTVYATVEGGTVKVHNGSSAQSVALASPTLASSYTITLPTSLPANGGPTLLRWDATGSIQAAASASFTESLDAVLGAALAGTTSYNAGGQGWSIGNPTPGNGVGTVDFPVNYQSGDRIDSIAMGTNGVGMTASLLFRSDSGAQATIVRCTFNTGSAGLFTLQSGTPTMTGTLPYTPPGTGSLYLEVTSTNNGNVEFKGYRVVRLRKIIS